MASHLPSSRYQALSNLGAPLAGGKIYTYEPGTTTPKATYTTQAGTTANDNPVILDAGGRKPIWLTGSYRIIVKDASDNTITDDDVISGGIAAADLAASTGAALSGAIYPTINAVAFNLQEYINDAGEYQLMGFVPQNLKAAIRNRTSTTDVRTYFQNCMDAVVDEQTFGAIRLPIGRVSIESAVNAAAGVSIFGSGGQSCLIRAVDCDAFSLGFYTGRGDVTFRGFGIDGTGTTRTAIKQPGSLDKDDQMFGVALQDLIITNFNKIVWFRNSQNVWIERVWGEHCNSGFDLSGKNLVTRIFQTQLVKGSGNGTGTSNAVLLDYFNFTSDGGNVAPEGAQIVGCQFYGFDNGINATAANYVNVSHFDIDARIYGIVFTTVQEGLNIESGFIAMQGAGSLAGIKGAGLASAIDAKINIDKVRVRGTTTTTCVGVQINDSGNQNQNHASVTNCSFKGMNTNDILLENAGPALLKNNRCQSTAPTNSISIPNVVVGSVKLEDNHCVKEINFTNAEAASGEIIVGEGNYKNDTTLMMGHGHAPTVASATAVTLPLGAEVFHISGTTTITSVVATGWGGREVTLIFDGILTFTDGSNLVLAGNFVTTANDVIRLACDGTNWFEIARSVN